MKLPKVMPWKMSFKLYSNWVFFAIAVIQGVQQVLPDWREFMEPRTWNALSMSLALAGIILRNIPQPELRKESNHESDRDHRRPDRDSTDTDGSGAGPQLGQALGQEGGDSRGPRPGVPGGVE